jgi:hypothetical protein
MQGVSVREQMQGVCVRADEETCLEETCLEETCLEETCLEETSLSNHALASSHASKK